MQDSLSNAVPLHRDLQQVGLNKTDVTDVEDNGDQKVAQKLLQDMLHLVMGIRGNVTVRYCGM